MTIQQIQAAIDSKANDPRQLINMIADYLQANPGGSPSPGGSSYLVAETEWDNDQIKGSASVYREVVPAQGANTYIKFLGAVLRWRIATTYTLSDSDSNISIFYGDGLAANMASCFSNIPNTTGNKVASIPPVLFVYTSPSIWATLGVSYLIDDSDCVNQPLKIGVYNSGGDLKGGNADNTLKVTVYYVVVDL